jgi:DNA polymerase III subunit epsilon
LNDRNKAILWAKSILEHPEKYYILDTETTGLTDPEIIELGVIDLDGKEIINQRFCPETDITDGASQIHGLTKDKLQNEPAFHSILEDLEEIVFQRQVLIYNFYFDHTAICHSYDMQNIILPSFSGECVMQWYSQFCGEWNDYRGSYRWQKLPGGDHSAIGDCRATLAVIKGMAESPMGFDLQPLEPPVVLETLPHT